MAMAGSILAAQYRGRADHKSVNHIATQALLSVSAIAVVISAIGYFFSPYLIKLMGAAPDVYADAVSYIKISFIGIIFLFMYMVFQSQMRAVGNVKTPMYIVMSTVFMNLVLDPLFIFGHGFFPAMGVSGAALASITTEGISVAIGLFILLKNKAEVQVSLKEIKPDFQLIKKMFRLGLPASIEQSSRALLLVLMTFLVVGFGTIITAAYGIGNRMLALVIIPTIGLSMATSTLVGQNMGAGKLARAERVVKISAITGFCALVFTGLLMFLFAKPLVGIFVPGNIETINQGALFLKILSVSFGFGATAPCAQWA